MFDVLVKEPEIGSQYHLIDHSGLGEQAALVEVLKIYEDVGEDGKPHKGWKGHDLKVVANLGGNFTPGEVFHQGYDTEFWHNEAEFFEVS